MLIPLDIFVKYQHNRNVIERRDAWLTLLVCDEPEKIIALIEKYPEFRQIYEEGYEICRNTERVMEMFSKELYELDRNTVQYMMDEQQERIDAQQEEIDAQQEEINAQRETIETQQETIESQKEMIAGMQEEAIKGTVHILRNVNIPEQEIITQICNQYRIREEEAKRYLQ